MDPSSSDAVGLGPRQHRIEVLFVCVHVAVGQQPEEVQRSVVRADIGQQVSPSAARKDPFGSDGFPDQCGALRKDAPGAEGVVAHLAVADVVVARHADGGAVGLQRGIQPVPFEPVHGRRPGEPHGVAEALLARSDSIHDHN